MADPYALDDAAAAALWMLSLQQDPSYEHIGALYADGDAIKRTGTVSTDQKGAVSGDIRLPLGRSSLRGLFHNHPAYSIKDGTARGATAKFSPEDREQAKALGVPSYISSGNRVMRYDGKTEEVLAAFPIDEWRAHMMRTLLDRAPDDPRGLTR